MCGRNPCVAPMCKGRDWILTSAQPKSVDAFFAEVSAYMVEHGLGRGRLAEACAAVKARALAEPCVFG